MGRACSGLESKGSFGHRKDAPPPQRNETQEKNPSWEVVRYVVPRALLVSRIKSRKRTKPHQRSPKARVWPQGPQRRFWGALSGGCFWGACCLLYVFVFVVGVLLGCLFFGCVFFLGSCWVPLVFLCLVMVLGPQRDAVGSRCGPFRLAPTGESRASVPGQTFQPRRTPTTLFAKCVP